MAAEIDFIGLDFSFTALITNMDLSLNISHLNIADVNVISDTFGKLSPLLIKTKINNGFRIVLPIINRILANNLIPFPSNFGLFVLSGLTLGYHDGYIYAGATPTFVAPTAEETSQVSAVEQLIVLTQ